MDKGLFELSSKHDDQINSSYVEHKHDKFTLSANMKIDESPIQLTSNYECGKQDSHGFGGLSLLYFLLNSGFSAFLPFLSIVLYRDGFELWEIGVLFSAAFFTSCIFSLTWDVLARFYNNNKQNLMVVSLLVWTGFLVPIFLVKIIPSKDPCVSIHIDNSSSIPSIESKHHENNSIIKAITNSNITDIIVTGKQKGLISTHISSHHLGLVIGLFVIARLLQSPTDYFYFDHAYLIKLKSVEEKTVKTNSHISTKVVSCFITLLAGFALDHVLYCDPIFGGFQISFYVFVVFLALATFVSYFLDVDLSVVQCLETKIVKNKNSKDKHLKIGCFKIVLGFFTELSLIISGISKSLSYTFIPLQLHIIRCSYIQIAVIFVMYKLSESLLKLYRQKLRWCKFEIVRLLFAIQCIEGIKLLLYSIVSSDVFIWLFIPLEILSGVSGLLSVYNDIQNSTIDNALVRSSSKIIFVLYWCIGFSIGPAIYGFSSHFYSTTWTFQYLGAINIASSCIIIISYTFIKSRQNKEQAKQQCSLTKSSTKIQEDEQDDDGDWFLYKSEFKHE